MSTVKVISVFETSKQKVWEAITNPEIMKIWYFDMSNFKLEIGNEFTFYEPYGNEFFHKCKVLSFEENKMFQHTWAHPQQSKGTSILTWNIEEIEVNKVKVSLIHEGLDSFADGGDKFAATNYEMGWNALIKTSLRNYLYNIQKLVFSVEIDAKANVVWNKLWNKNSYKQWVAPFCEGTYYTGEIKLGNRIHFISPSFDGMYCDVFYLDVNKNIIFKYIGKLKDLKEQPIDAETEKWTGCFEAYKLNEINGITTVTAEMECMEEYINYMKEKFPLALQELKKISE